MTRRRLELDAAALEAQRDHLARGCVVFDEAGDGVAHGSAHELELVRADGEILILASFAVDAGDGRVAFALRDVSGAACAEIVAWAEEPLAAGAAEAAAGAAAEAAAAAEAVEAVEAVEAEDTEADAAIARRPGHQNPHEKLRGLNLAQQLKVARDGEVSERIVLERLYGKAVWEALLRNPRLTHPEVAHIARMGALPRPLIELIVSNLGWLQSPQVRRALLTNPRLGNEQIERVLRQTPKNELRVVPNQTAYPLGVRAAAKKLLKPG